jgi:hypothetical protein
MRTARRRYLLETEVTMRSRSDDDIASCEGQGLQVRVGLHNGPQQLDFDVILSGKNL